ncbi:hypothetical protein H8B13_10060 [Hymenobacter sp. BT188]|uniref:hypothetical protein n=1 Tax=Hymenobacter sp. BT188 TaxID=2763504 RepID=UPI001650FD22|nr:hypothetical protein [Hymenobacter sp. BT188]MBC6607163.1 hypothetical protein [Hymenobacter sp. BT188]
MALFYSFSRLAAITVVALLTGCAKESDSIAPAKLKAAPTDQFAVGDQWEQGQAVTGLSCPVLMTIVKEATPADGQIAKWVGHAACPPPVKLIYKAEYTTPDGAYTFLYNTTTQPTGEVTMTTFYLASKQ